MTIETGEQAPTFTLPDAAEGQEHDLSAALQRGPAVVSIYKSSCGASKAMFPMLERIAQAYPSDNVTVLGIAQDSSNVTRSFARRSGVTFPLLVEGDEYPVSRAFDVEATPTVYLIDKDGNIVWQTMGFQKPAVEELSAKVAEMIGTEPVDVVSNSDDIPNWVPG